MNNTRTRRTTNLTGRYRWKIGLAHLLADATLIFSVPLCFMLMIGHLSYCEILNGIGLAKWFLKRLENWKEQRMTKTVPTWKLALAAAVNITLFLICLPIMTVGFFGYIVYRALIGGSRLASLAIDRTSNWIN